MRRDGAATGTPPVAAGADDRLGLPEVLAEERRVLRGDEAPARDLDHERATRLRAAVPWRALCLSGGGLRAAVFSLGVAQGLAARGGLHRFDYLSTASGGSYTGGALAAFAARLRGSGGPPDSAPAGGPPSAEPDEPMARVGECLARADGPASRFVGHLREYASYLAPRLGMLSPDLAAMLALTLRNLAIVWLVLLPVMTMLMLGPQFVAMTLHELAMPDDRASQQFAFGAGAAVLLAWCFVYPELATCGRWPWLGTRAGLAVGLLGPLGFASLLLLVAALSVERPSPEAIAAPGAGLDALEAWLGPAVRWLPVGVLAIATVRVLLRRLLRGPCDARTLARQWLGAVIGGLAVGALALVLLAETGRSWLAAIDFEGAAGWFTGSRVLDATMLAGPALMSLWLVFDVIHVGIASGRRDDLDREHMASVTASVLLAAALWLAWCALSFGRPILLFAPQEWLLGPDLRSAFVPVLAAACVAVLSVVGVRWLAAPLHDIEADSPEGRRVRRDGRIAGVAALLLLVVVLRALAASGTAWLEAGDELALRAGRIDGSPTGQVERRSVENTCANLRRASEVLPCAVARDGAAGRWLELIGVFAAWGLLAGVLIQVNRFSMHEIYRTRVARTFLGASRAALDAAPGAARRPDPLTGFDRDDDLPMHALRGLRPMLVVNTALNRSNSEALGGQERRALPFSISPLHAGAASPAIGYRRAERYASLGRLEAPSASDPDGGMRLGTVVALSGAATSPSMGYGTHPLVSFVLTLFNVRLGLWLGNPGSNRAWVRSEPPFSVVPLLRDLVADTDDRGPWINLSDGGHFDNLGLYEMLQRRCRLMVCVDATSDGQGDLHHLARVVRMAGVDLGVSIEALPVDDPSPRPAILAYRVAWPDAVPDADGLLLVIKPVLCGDEPVDVAQYARSHPEFPHESTADQFFGEGQFECYRRLGRLSVDRLERFVDGPLRAHPWAGALVDLARAG